MCSASQSIEEMCYFVTQRFKLAPITITPFRNKYDFKNLAKPPQFMELFVYCLVFGMFAFTLLFGGVPIFR